MLFGFSPYPLVCVSRQICDARDHFDASCFQGIFIAGGFIRSLFKFYKGQLLVSAARWRRIQTTRKSRPPATETTKCAKSTLPTLRGHHHYILLPTLILFTTMISPTTADRLMTVERLIAAGRTTTDQLLIVHHPMTPGHQFQALATSHQIMPTAQLCDLLLTGSMLPTRS